VLILVRHGRTQGNAAGLLQGRLDNPLDDVGRRQAEQIAAAIGPVDQVITSSLSRAAETASLFGVTPIVDDRWIEIDYGDFDGCPVADVPREIWDKWRTDADYAPPGGESMAAMDARVRTAAAEALEISRELTTVVVSHVSPIKAAVVWALGGQISMSWRLYVHQAAVSRIGQGPSGPVLRSFNEVLYDM
jgi:broad specificity phosphatase PhoE